MKVFISQPMRGLTGEQILDQRARGLAFVRENFPNENIELIDTFFPDFNGNRLEFLGKSILDGLAKADLALFIGKYKKYDGCAVEHTAAVRYGVRRLYFDQK